jgi:hypothetical protein
VNESVTLRPRFGKVLCVCVWVIMAVTAVSLIATLDVERILRYSPGLLLIAFGAWLLFWRPAVKVEPYGVELINLLRTRSISWPAIQRIDTKYALTLFTSGGKFTAWAAPSPGRATLNKATRQDLRGLPESSYGPGNTVAIGDVPTSESGAASLLVRRQWEWLRDEGHLESGAVEGSGVKTTWHYYSAAALVILIVAAILGATL